LEQNQLFSPSVEYMVVPRTLRNSTACYKYHFTAESAYGHFSGLSQTPVPAATLHLFALAQDGLEPASTEECVYPS
jgi:hypothetical protein